MYSLAYVYITILSSKLIIIATIISLSLWAHCHTHMHFSNMYCSLYILLTVNDAYLLDVGQYRCRYAICCNFLVEIVWWTCPSRFSRRLFWIGWYIQEIIINNKYLIDQEEVCGALNRNTCIDNVMPAFRNWPIAKMQNSWIRHNWSHDCIPHGSQTEM